MKNVAILAIVIASSIVAVGFNVANAIPQQCLLKDEKAALDTFISDWRNYVYTQLPIEVQDPIFNTYKELAKLSVCENMKGYVKKSLLVDTYTGAMAINATNLSEMEKIYTREGFSRMLADKLFKNYVLPFPTSLKTTVQKEEIVEPVKKMPIEGHEVPFGASSTGISDNVDVSILICINERPPYSKALFNVSSSVETRQLETTWVLLGSDDVTDIEFWCTDGSMKVKGGDFVKRSEITKDIKVVYAGGSGTELKKPTKMKIEEMVIPPSEPYIDVLGVIETQIPGKYLVGFRICAGNTKLLTPEIILHSDKDETEVSVYANIAPKSCFTTDVTIQADDWKSIRIEFKKQQVSDTSLESLKAEIDALKKQMNKPSIPNWIKNNAKWWADKQIGDADFVQGIQYLITQEIIKIPETKAGSGTSQDIPAWIRNNAKWWADGQISDDDFISGIQYLISSGIMKIN